MTGELYATSTLLHSTNTLTNPISGLSITYQMKFKHFQVPRCCQAISRPWKWNPKFQDFQGLVGTLSHS